MKEHGAVALRRYDTRYRIFLQNKLYPVSFILNATASCSFLGELECVVMFIRRNKNDYDSLCG